MIDRKVLVYWGLCSLILVFGIQIIDRAPLIDNRPQGLFGAFIGVLLLVVSSTVLSAVLAAFPFTSKAKGGARRVRSLLPACTVLITFGCLLAFLLTRPSYGQERAAANNQCVTVKEGRFRMGEYLVERKGDYQRESSTGQNLKETFRVKWINDCEFLLFDLRHQIKDTRVKITRVTEAGYECIAEQNGRSARYELVRLTTGE